MLLELSIKELAIIDDLTVSLGPGLNVFTGETGAGKSIIIDAIDLVLGDRASNEAIRGSRDEARVEAMFDASRVEGLEGVFEEAGIPSSENLIIKRTIQRAGRNRVSINGSIATLMTLTEVGRRLIDICGQSEHQSLTRPEEHVELLDAFGGFSKERQAMARAHSRFNGFRRELEKLLSDVKRSGEERELLSFQSKEIGAAALSPGEEEGLKAEVERLKNADRLGGLSAGVEEALYSGEGSVTERLGEFVKGLREGAAMDPSLEKAAAAVEKNLFELEEVASALRDYSAAIEGDPTRLEEVEARIDAIIKLKRKYGATIDDILKKKEEIDRLLSGMEGSEGKLVGLKEQESAARDEARRVALALGEARVEAAARLKQAIEKDLGGLGMGGTVFEASVEAEKDPDGNPRTGEKGADRVSFHISSNPGEDLKPLARIASGGELSRIMLAMKRVTAVGRVPTLIFDEVDTGIGGGMAEVVGRKLKEVSKTHQVLCVTHLPQIAAFADNHYAVAKVENEEGRTVTRVKELRGEERVGAIATMLGGEKVTDTMVKHATELLQNAGKV
ncbi:MAG: DNA repair protein RecN [Thermodesulfobacteriota bacterium]